MLMISRWFCQTLTRGSIALSQPILSWCAGDAGCAIITLTVTFLIATVGCLIAIVIDPWLGK
jgi:hypothetical protein